MTKPDFTLEFIKDSTGLRRLVDSLIALPAFALDIETSDWWNRQRERVALIQIAFRTAGKIKVVIVDALADFDLLPLRLPLEQSSSVKIIHNAAFDAHRLETHYDFKVAPIFDTMAAARRSGERRYSLKAQADIHLNLRLDKSERGSDWSRRPLDPRQLYYAALDPYATLLLYESQTRRHLNGDYRLKPLIESTQNLLPLGDSPARVESAYSIEPQAGEFSSAAAQPERPEATEEMMALLGIITELPSRYSPDGLAASVGGERVGLAGWIIDRRLGTDAEPDEETVKCAITGLCANGLIRITGSRRLEATETGAKLWQRIKADSEAA